MQETFNKFESVFAGPLGQIKFGSHRIRLVENAHPLFQRPYRLSPRERQAEENINEMLAQGVLEPSISPWVFPNVLVKKKTGELRIAANFKRLNDLTVKDSYAMPRIDDVLSCLDGSSFFKILDANHRFHQANFDEDCREMLMMISHAGFFRYKRMPLGLMNSPATF